MISDTHGMHDDLGRLSGDVLIHCGDFEDLFSRSSDELDEADDWLGQQDFDLILCTGGNHDLALERRVQDGVQPLRNAAYLQDSEFVWRGVRFYGAPWVPDLYGHAFYADDRALADAWDTIPQNVDVLITHTPPRGILDVSSRGDVLGCPHLTDRLKSVKPALHCFGHVHHSSGHQSVGGTTHVNASVIGKAYEIAHPPFVFDLDIETMAGAGAGNGG